MMEVITLTEEGNRSGEDAIETEMASIVTSKFVDEIWYAQLRKTTKEQ